MSKVFKEVTYLIEANELRTDCDRVVGKTEETLEGYG